MKGAAEGAAGAAATAAEAAAAAAAAGAAATAAEAAAAAAAAAATAAAAAAAPAEAEAKVKASKPEESYLDLNNKNNKKLSKLGTDHAKNAGFGTEDIETMNTNIAKAVARFTDEKTREFSPKITKKYMKTILPPPEESDDRHEEKSDFHSALEKDLTHALRMQQMQQQVYHAQKSMTKIIEKDGVFENRPTASRKKHAGKSLFLAAAKTRPAKTFRDPKHRVEITLGHTVGPRLTEKGVFPLTFGHPKGNAKNTVDMKIAIGSLEAALEAGARTPQFGAKDAYKDKEGKRNSPLFDTLSDDQEKGLKAKLEEAITQYNNAGSADERREAAGRIKQIIEQGTEDLKKELSDKDLQAKRKDIDSFVTLYATSVIQDMKLDAILGKGNHAAPTREALQQAQLETFNLIDKVKDLSADPDSIAEQQTDAVNEIKKLMEPYASKEDQEEAARVGVEDPAAAAAAAAADDDDDDDEKDEKDEKKEEADAGANEDEDEDESKVANPKKQAEAIEYQGDNIKQLETKVAALKNKIAALKDQVNDDKPKVKDNLKAAQGALKDTRKKLKKNQAKVNQLNDYIEKIEQEAGKANKANNAETNTQTKAAINSFVHKAKKIMGKSTHTDKMPDLMTQMSNQYAEKVTQGPNAATKEELVGAYHNSLKKADPATLDDDARMLQENLVIVANANEGKMIRQNSRGVTLGDETEIKAAKKQVQNLPIFKKAAEVRKALNQKTKQVKLSTRPTSAARQAKHEHMEAIKMEIDEMLVNDADGIESDEGRIETLISSANDRGISSAELNKLIQGADETNWKRYTEDQKDRGEKSPLRYAALENKKLNPGLLITRLKGSLSKKESPATEGADARATS